MDQATDPNPRLEPTRATIKSLFALSGNQCAFPQCPVRLVNEFGEVVSQIAHIRGVKPGAARFDPSVDADELRNRDNLVVLCYEHHVRTNDVTVYSVEEMKRIKADHEAKYDAALDQLLQTVKDKTQLASAIRPTTLVAYANACGLDLNEEAHVVADFRAKADDLLSKLVLLSPNLRAVFATVLERGHSDDYSFELTLNELEEVLGIPSEALRGIPGDPCPA